MHFEPIERFDNARCVTVCDSGKDLSIPNYYSSNLSVYTENSSNLSVYSVYTARF